VTKKQQAHNAQTQATSLLLRAFHTFAKAPCRALLVNLQLKLHCANFKTEKFAYSKQANKKQFITRNNTFAKQNFGLVRLTCQEIVAGYNELRGI